MYKRNVQVNQVIETTTFAKANSIFYLGTPRLIGGSQNSQDHLSSNDGLLKSILPTVIALSPNSPDWGKVVKAYIISFNLNVPSSGLFLNISMNFSKTDERTMKSIKSILTTFKKSDLLKKFEAKNTDNGFEDEFGEFIYGDDVAGKKICEEVDIYKYGNPVNPQEYYTYLYLLFHNRVANKFENVSKSPKIQYYLTHEDDIQKRKKKEYNLRKKINKLLYEIEDDTVKLNNVCVMLNIDERKIEDKVIAVNDLAQSDPAKVIGICEDKNLSIKATITNYINAGLLNRLAGSSTIVEANDPANIIGINMDSAVTTFSNTEKAQLINMLSEQYKALIQKR